MYNIIIIKEKNKTINYALNTHFFSLVELMMTHNIGFTSLLCFHLVFFVFSLFCFIFQLNTLNYNC